MMVIELKTTQWVEPNEEPIDRFSSTGQMVQKPYLFQNVVKVDLNRSRSSRGPVKGQLRSNGHLPNIKY